MKKSILMLVSLLALLAAHAASAMDEPDPFTLIRDATSSLLESLDAHRDQFAENPELLHELVDRDLLPLIDLRYSARLILGAAGRGVPVEKIDAFGEALSNIMLDRYAHVLLNFRSGDQLDVLPIAGKNTAKLTRVRTRVKLDNGRSVPIDYAFHLTEAGWQVFDVTVEGISYVMTFRNQIAPRAEAEGIDKVTEEIRSGTIQLETK